MVVLSKKTLCLVGSALLFAENNITPVQADAAPVEDDEDEVAMYLWGLE